MAVVHCVEALSAGRDKSQGVNEASELFMTFCSHCLIVLSTLIVTDPYYDTCKKSVTMTALTVSVNILRKRDVLENLGFTLFKMFDRFEINS